MFASVTYSASDYEEYKEQLDEYNSCVQTSENFGGGPECIEPVYTNCTEFSKLFDYCPAIDVDTPVVYDNGFLHLNDITVIINTKVTALSYVKMKLVDGVFVIVETIE